MVARQTRPDTRAIATDWQWPKSRAPGRNLIVTPPAIDKGLTPSYLSPIPAGNAKTAVL